MKPFGTVLAIAAATAIGVSAGATSSRAAEKEKENTMELGAFSVSLAVKDLKASRTFYEKLGFTQIGGDETQNYLILQNGNSTVGIFQGMFERNILTFNPGWDSRGEDLADFQDIRDIQRELKEQGLSLQTEADAASDGPASVVLVDPDGNPILIDQHIPKPN